MMIGLKQKTKLLLLVGVTCLITLLVQRAVSYISDTIRDVYSTNREPSGFQIPDTAYVPQLEEKVWKQAQSVRKPGVLKRITTRDIQPVTVSVSDDGVPFDTLPDGKKPVVTVEKRGRNLSLSLSDSMNGRAIKYDYRLSKADSDFELAAVGHDASLRETRTFGAEVGFDLRAYVPVVGAGEGSVGSVSISGPIHLGVGGVATLSPRADYHLGDRGPTFGAEARASYRIRIF